VSGLLVELRNRQQNVQAPGTNARGDTLFFLGLPVFLMCHVVKSAAAVNHSSCAEEEA